MNVFELYRLLGRLERLQQKRHPLFEQNRVTKWLIGFSAAYSGAALLLLGALLGQLVMQAHLPPLVWLDKFLPTVLLLDYIGRITLQQPMHRRLKPLLLLPLGRKRLLSMLMLRTGLQYINLLWLLPVVPYAVRTLGPAGGALPVCLLIFGMWLLLVLNGYFYQLCRMLCAERTAWMLLPMGCYLGAIAAGLLPEGDPFGLAPAFAAGRPWSFCLMPVLTALLTACHIRLERQFLYDELAHRSDRNIKHTARYAFLSHGGETGEFIRLQLRLMTRNKMPKRQIMAMGLVILYAVCMICFVDGQDRMSNGYLVGFSFFLSSVVLASRPLGYDGNYFDGLMCRSGAMEHLLRAIYLSRMPLLVIPLLTLLVPVYLHRIPLLQVVACGLFTAGVLLCGVMRFSLSDCATLPLNAPVARGSAGRSWQQLMLVMALLMLSHVIFIPVRWLGDAWYWGLCVTGAAFMAGHRIWIRQLCRRFMKHRYDYMDKLRSTR